MGYEVTMIDSKESQDLKRSFEGRDLFSSKVDVIGLCVELITDDRDYMDMWEDNFSSMSENVKPHARLYAMKGEGKCPHLKYDPRLHTGFLLDFDYYGWVKSIALGICGDIMEEAHGVNSVHGAVLDIDGRGVTLIAPSKTGKTTHSWGLLRMRNAHLISDDWYFVEPIVQRPMAYRSEKNCYIDADIGDVWDEYKPLIRNVKFDNKGRGIANVRWVIGHSAVMPMTAIRFIFLLKRDPDDKSTIRKMTSQEGYEYMVDNDFCNPHQIVRDADKSRIRMDFMKKFFDSCEVYMVNTTKRAEDVQKEIQSIISACEAP